MCIIGEYVTEASVEEMGGGSECVDDMGNGVDK